MDSTNSVARELGIHTGQIESLQKDVSTMRDDVHAIKEKLNDLENLLSEYKGYGRSLVGMAAAVGSILSAILTAFITNLIHKGG